MVYIQSMKFNCLFIYGSNNEYNYRTQADAGLDFSNETEQMNSICKIHEDKQFRKNNIFVPACDWLLIQTSQTSNMYRPQEEIELSLESNDVELDRG